MSIQISYGGYQFSFQVITTGNVYDVDQVQRVQEHEQIVFRTSELSYGAGTGTVAAFFEVVFEEDPSGIHWQARAEHSEPIKGIKVMIESFPLGDLITPPGVRTQVPEGPGRCFVYPCGSHPIHERGGETGIIPATGDLPGMSAQFVLIEGAEQTVCIYTHEYPLRVKRYWFYRVGEGLEVHLYSEENASERRSEYTAPVWHIDRAGSLHEAVESYSTWMEDAFDLVPFEQRSDTPEWLRKIALVTILHGVSSDGKICHNFAEMEARLHELARMFPPEHTLIKLTGYEGRIDYHVPDNLPGEELGGHAGFSSFMETAHRLGFKVLLHLNIWGMTYDHPLFPQMRQHQIYDSCGRPTQWSVDFDKDETLEMTFAYISPDVPEFRKVLLACVRHLMEIYAPDAIHMDQSAFLINDLRHNHMRGVAALFKELNEAFPGIVFTGEGPTEWVAGLYPLSSGLGYLWYEADIVDEIFLRTISRYMRCYAHSVSIPPEPYRGVWTLPHIRTWWSEERFRKIQEVHERLHVVPTLVLTDKRIRLDGDLSQMVINQAQRWLTEYLK
jgi:hypothetical protein